MAVLVRAMRVEDAPAVADLTTQLGYPASEEEIRRRFAGLGSEDDALYVAEVDQTVVGWIHGRAVCLLELDPIAEIWGLVVGVGSRGHGTGVALIEAVERWARERGLDTIQVRSNVIRERAHRFYQGEGYDIVKTSYTMSKPLRG